MLTTLLVEDNNIYRKTLKELLKKNFPKLTLHEAVNGDEVMGKVKKIKPKLIFMDIHIPGENGLKLTKKIRNLGYESVIIVLTSYNTLEYRQTATRNGANYFLLKDTSSPNRILTLVAAIISRIEIKMMAGLPDSHLS